MFAAEQVFAPFPPQDVQTPLFKKYPVLHVNATVFEEQVNTLVVSAHAAQVVAPDALK